VEWDAPQGEREQWPGKQQRYEQEQPPGYARTGHRDRREFSHGKKKDEGECTWCLQCTRKTKRDKRNASGF
jgi:hypothetical protein